MLTRYRRVSDGTDDYVHGNPWKSIALAAVGGLLIGCWFRAERQRCPPHAGLVLAQSEGIDAALIAASNKNG